MCNRKNNIEHVVFTGILLIIPKQLIDSVNDGHSS